MIAETAQKSMAIGLHMKPAACFVAQEAIPGGVARYRHEEWSRTLNLGWTPHPVIGIRDEKDYVRVLLHS